jgi:hypothetical protein
VSIAVALLVAAEVAPICTDRPTKANAVCTVPEGAWQVETALAGWSLTKADGVETEAVVIGASFLKLGLSGRSDLQVGFTPFTRLTVDDGPGRNHVSAVGDVVVRYKHRVTASSARTQVAVIPYVKLPTASDGIGNGDVEAGLAVPVSFALPGSTTFTLGPEAALLADADGAGRHLAVVNLANLSVPVGNRLMVAGELWSNLNFDPAGTVRQASADAALAYAISPGSQVDIGVNVGLTQATSDIELYAGISFRL